MTVNSIYDPQTWKSASWYTGSSNPSSLIGQDNDYFFNTASQNILIKSQGTWIVLANIAGDVGDTGQGLATTVFSNRILSKASGANFDTVFRVLDQTDITDALGYLPLTAETDNLQSVSQRGSITSNSISITNTTESSNTTTGALVVMGGLGVAKNITANEFIGPLNGTLTGTVTGTVTGAVTGTVIGSVVGNVTGNATGYAGTVTGGVYAYNTYTDPSWLTLTPAKLNLATVASTGSYTDLINKPSQYTLPIASSTTLGGVRPDGQSITISNGIISGYAGYTLPMASTTTLGGVRVDGTTITINDGIITRTNVYVLPVASTSTLGGVKVDGVTIVSNNGVISALAPTIPQASLVQTGISKIDNSTLIFNSSGQLTWNSSRNSPLISQRLLMNNRLPVVNNLPSRESGSAWFSGDVKSKDLTTVDDISDLKFDRTGRYLFVITPTNNKIYVFRIDEVTNSLIQQDVNIPYSGVNFTPRTIIIHPNNRWYFIPNNNTSAPLDTNYVNHLWGSFDTRSTSSVTHPLFQITNTYSGRIQANRSREMEVDPRGRWMYQVSEVDSTLYVRTFSFSGFLNNPVQTFVGNILYVTPHPNGLFVYLTNGITYTTTAHTISSEGIITDTPISSSLSGITLQAKPKIDRQGRYMVTIIASQLAVASIDSITGALGSWNIYNVVSGTLDAVEFDPSGDFILVKGLRTGTYTGQSVIVARLKMKDFGNLQPTSLFPTSLNLTGQFVNLSLSSNLAKTAISPDGSRFVTSDVVGSNTRRRIQVFNISNFDAGTVSVSGQAIADSLITENLKSTVVETINPINTSKPDNVENTPSTEYLLKFYADLIGPTTYNRVKIDPQGEIIVAWRDNLGAGSCRIWNLQSITYKPTLIATVSNSEFNQVILDCDIVLENDIYYIYFASATNIFTVSLNRITNSITVNGPQFSGTDNFQRIRFDPSGIFLFGQKNSSTAKLTSFRRDADSYIIREIDQCVEDLQWPYGTPVDLAVHPTGKFVARTVLSGQPTFTRTVRLYQYNSEGVLTLLETNSSGNLGPTSIAWSPDGRVLACYGVSSNSVDCTTIFNFDYNRLVNSTGTYLRETSALASITGTSVLKLAWHPSGRILYLFTTGGQTFSYRWTQSGDHKPNIESTNWLNSSSTISSTLGAGSLSSVEFSPRGDKLIAWREGMFGAIYSLCDYTAGTFAAYGSIFNQRVTLIPNEPAANTASVFNLDCLLGNFVNATGGLPYNNGFTFTITNALLSRFSIQEFDIFFSTSATSMGTNWTINGNAVTATATGTLTGSGLQRIYIIIGRNPGNTIFAHARINY